MCDTTLRVERRYADGSWGAATLTSGEDNPFTILRNRFASLSGSDVTTDASGKEVRAITHTFDGLPTYDANGEKISYRVVETSPVAADGFVVTYFSDNGLPSDADGYESTEDGTVLDSNRVTVTNTYDHGDTAQVAVVKELLGRFERHAARRLRPQEVRRFEARLSKAVGKAFGVQSDEMPSLGVIYRAFEADALETRRPRRLVSKMIRRVLIAVLMVVCAVVFWLAAVLIQPVELHQPSSIVTEQAQ
jgi:hypothetical protein